MQYSGFNGIRLKEARLFHQKTIVEIAEMLNVTKQTIFKYENGNSTPDQSVVFKIVKELEFPTEFFYMRDSISMRFKEGVLPNNYLFSKKEREALIQHQKYLVVIREYLENNIIFPKLNWNLSGKNLTPQGYAKYIRNYWKLGNKKITSMTNLLEKNGFVLSTKLISNNKIETYSSTVFIKNNKYRVIILDENLSFYDRQINLAIELGHWLLHGDINNIQNLTNKETNKLNEEAYEFALHFLMPVEILEKNLINKTELDMYSNLKVLWNMSVQTILSYSRLTDNISVQEYKKLKRQYNYRDWNKTEPIDIESDKNIPILLRQSIELLIENDVIEGYEIPMAITKEFGISLSSDLIEKITKVKKGALKYREPQIVSLADIKINQVD